MKSRFALLALFALLSVNAFSFPLPYLGQPTPPLNFSTTYDYEGIVALSNCSGSLVQFENAPSSDKALVLTNGHCIENGFPRPGEVLSGVASRRHFSLLDSRGRDAGRVSAAMLIYATMTGTDMALYRLHETYAEIFERHGVRPLKLSPRRPSVGDSIEVISGYWNRGFTCQIEHFVFQLREGSYLMNDSIRYTRPGCEVYGGTSGSPVIHQQTREVIGVNNTGNESGRSCTINNPCEIDENGNLRAERGLAYGQQTYWVYSCLNELREIDLNRPGCMLPQ